MTDLAALQALSDRGSLVDQVRDSIRAAITSGRLDPGDRLREIPLSKHFGVSTTPVREALRRLESEGLVQVHPRRGAVVTALEYAVVADLYDLRLLLEVEAVRLAASRTELDLGPVYSVLAELEQLVGQGDAAFAEADARLHRAISDLGGNRELAAEAERVHRRIQAARVRASVPGRLRAAQDQHAEIVEALRLRDAGLAQEAVRRHIGSAKENVLGVLRARAAAADEGPDAATEDAARQLA
ncbi:GntR family transcriptional regulator [Oryzobacter sp. R7]|uniref:GntR family transcriptional regulator n=1 Tax=Oryzobacter faecalis TaxID=3388656 RepID=UPI00398CA400